MAYRTHPNSIWWTLISSCLFFGATPHQNLDKEILYVCVLISKLKEMRHIEMPEAAPKSPIAIFKTRDDVEMK